MTPERWLEIERVYHAALAAAPEARAAILAEACAQNDDLRNEVASLLAQASVSGLLDRSPDALAKSPVSPSASVASGTGPAMRRVGVFELQALLGAGGMGEVYRARDTRLGRDVALKILPEAFKSDPARVARFAREARVLASLNHPHIAALYGLEEADDVTALVMELVEGNDLSQSRTWRMDQALAIAKQISEALEAAHEQGVVHRDLKPGNIRLRIDGTVKVLDFGLATALGTASDDARILAERQTRDGAIIGTPAYMSPEQARGEPVSRHADIWAFGVILYELLTDVCPFARPTTAETLASVLSEQPDAAQLPAETPETVRRLIRRCLEKDPKRRLQHIGDARLELEEALAPSAADVPIGTVRRVPTVVWTWRTRLGVAAVFAVVAFSGLGGFWLARRPVPVRVVRTNVLAEAYMSDTDRGLLITPDGSALGYISSDANQMMLQPLDALEPVPILKTAAFIRGMFGAPDGRWFGYVENNFVLKKVPATGGTPVTVLTMDGPSRGAAWGPGDAIVFATAALATGIQRVSASGGPVTVLTRPNPQNGEADHLNPVWLPDGRGVLFTVTRPQGGLDVARVAVLNLATGAWRTLEGGHGARYVKSGHLVYAAAGGLWAIPFDLDRLETYGAPREVVRPVSVGVLGATAEFDIANDGTLAYSRSVHPGNRRLPVLVDCAGRETPLPIPPGNYGHPRFSPDGKRLALVHNSDIFVWEWTRPWSTATRLTFDPAIDWAPVWTPDSRRILFGSWRGSDVSNLYSYDLETGSTERLTESPDMQHPTAISRDGTTLIFHSFGKRLEALRLPPRAAPVTLVETPFEERNGVLSPDGQWLAYEGENTSALGELDVYVRSFPDVDRGLWQVSRGGGMYPLWARSGRELFYVTLDGTMVSVPVEASGISWKTGSPTPVFRGRYVVREGSLGRLFDVGPDGRFLMLKGESGAEPAHIVLVQNWVAELARQMR